MKVGDVLRVRRLSQDAQLGRIEAQEWTAERGRVFVVVVLGTEPYDGSAPLDVNAALAELGWTPPAKAQP